jgi:hypothetical protein
MARLLLFEIVLGGCIGGGVVARQKQFAKPSPLSAEGNL